MPVRRPSKEIGAKPPDGSKGSLPRANEIFEEHKRSIFAGTDRLLACLLVFQWVAAIVVSLMLSSPPGAGGSAAFPQHSGIVFVFGGIIASLPALLAWRLPGKTLTRHAIAIAQMMMSTLLIHISGGQIETYFHTFCSLVFLAFYRDWRVLVTASAVTVLDHLLWGLNLPLSLFGAYGIRGNMEWRWAQYAGWVVLENIFLIWSCLRSLAEMRTMAERQAALEATNAKIAVTAEELRLSGAELEQARDHLEVRVQERTRELEASRTDLRVGEERFRTTMESLLEGCQIIGHDWRYLYVNATAAQHGQRTAAELLGRTMGEAFPGIESTGMFAALRYCMEQRVPGQTENEFIYPDGSSAWFELVIQPVPEGLFILSLDITERKRAQARQDALTIQLSRSNAALHEFFFIASHDLKEPLRKIQSFGNLLERKAGESLGPEQRSYLHRMTEAAGRMQVLLQALVEYAQVIGKVREIEEVDLNQVAARALMELEETIVDLNPRIEIDPLPTIQADPVQMRQLFRQLLGNALKFRRPDVEVQVRVTARGEGKAVCLVFSDNGIGFAPAYADRIFQMFERVEGRGSVQASGAGLSICRKIVERHGGTITAEGCPGDGATFTVWLPLAHQGHSV